jgi:hypothetical protein
MVRPNNKKLSLLKPKSSSTKETQLQNDEILNHIEKNQQPKDKLYHK